MSSLVHFLLIIISMAAVLGTGVILVLSILNYIQVRKAVRRGIPEHMQRFLR